MINVFKYFTLWELKQFRYIFLKCKFDSFEWVIETECKVELFRC